MGQTVTHEGIVAEISPQTIAVRVVQQTACAGCHARQACSASESAEKLIEVPNRYDSVQVGDRVVVEVSASLGLKAVFWAFGLPLLILFAVISLSLYYLQNEAWAAALALAALVVYFVVLYALRDRFRKAFVFNLV